MDIVDKAKEIGKMIESSEEYQSFRNAETLFLNDTVIQHMFNEYKNAYNQYARTKDKNLEGIIDSHYNTLLKNSIYIDYIESKKKFENLMNTVNGLVNYYVDYNNKSCSSNCGGCKKHKS